MAPRAGAFVKIVSPNSGNISIPSRSSSLCPPLGGAAERCATRPHRRCRDGSGGASSSPSLPRRRADSGGSSSSASRGADGGGGGGGSSSRHAVYLPRRAPQRASSSSSRQGRHDVNADDGAVMDGRRMRAMLEAAGRRVLRGTRLRSHLDDTTTVREDKHGEQALWHVQTPALQLPPSVPPRTQDDGSSNRNRSSSEDDDSEDDDDASTRRRRAASLSSSAPPRKRPRSGVLGEARSRDDDDDDVTTTTVAVTAAEAVCPAMFSGVSAIPLAEHLFDGCGGGGGGDKRRNDRCAHMDGTVAALPSTAARRCCVRPLWTLVGSYTTALSSVVDIDSLHDCIRWHQRNPHGVRQQLRVPLHAVYDATVTEVVQTLAANGSKGSGGGSDVLVARHWPQQTTRTYTLVVCAHARPSRVVFGFATRSEAAHMRTLVLSSSSSSAASAS